MARFASRVAAILAEPHAAKATWGILIVDRDSGQTLYDRHADGFFTPASNTKLFTSAFALSALGSDYHFHTTIETATPPDAQGRVHGDIVLVGRGDPDLSNRKFPYLKKAEREGPEDKVLEELADGVAAKGVTQIDGDIVADESYFFYDPYPEGWAIGDLYFEFGAPITAIALNDNALTIAVQPGEHAGDPAILAVEPWAGYETFAHDITTAPANAKAKFSVVRGPGPHPVFLRGSIPAGAAPMKLDIALDEPAEYSARILHLLLEARGVRVVGGTRVVHGPLPDRDASGAVSLVPPPENNADAAGPPVVLAEHVSPPLLESIRLLNKISQNLHAELILRTVAKEKTGVGTTDAGIEIEGAFLRSIGIADGDVVLADGSGLSRQNLVTPRAVVELLQYASKQPWGDSFISTLPVAAVDGTLEDRMKGTAAAGRILAKTGSHDHVRVISGYATTSRDAHLIFSIFTNNDPAPPHETTTVEDSIAVAMVEEIRPAPRKSAAAAHSAPRSH
ncbi:MAG TPA: D-alanyl-D-alanine carboxypeptidase/D-alanyl-D-alanine-endopeptidase [Candidatus Acidoferrales bacterium]|nr:D-alanyl-D-alanine carboxypeptidase/D-alanyl-D-alanine-endopeptidase [Candidatus Acidoferrales bacterium]